MACQETEQVAARNEHDDAFSIRNRFRGLWLVVEYRDVGKRATRPEHFEYLFAALRRGRDGPHAPLKNDTEPAGWIALPEDHVARLVAALSEACGQRLEIVCRQRAKIRGLSEEVELGSEVHIPIPCVT